MKGEDIDKIFRDALGGQKAPTTEHDWAAFEGMLDAQKGGWSKWTVLMLLLILILGGAGAYYTFDGLEAPHNSKDQNTKTVLEQNNKRDGNDSKSTVPVSEMSIQGSDQYNAADTGKTSVTDYTALSASETSPDTTGSNLSQKQQTATSPQAISIDLAETTGESKNENLASRYTHKPAPSEHKAKGAPDDGLSQSSKPADAVLLQEKGNLRKGDASMAASPSYTESYSSSSEIPLSSFETELDQPKLMTRRGTEMDMTIAPMLNGEKRKVEMQKHHLFLPLIYFKLEQNNVLRTSTAIGIGIERIFPQKGKGDISVQGAIGYQRSGRLAWEQSSQTVTYGFDRYVEESNLRTDHLEMIQLPIRVTYLTGVHRVFAGAQLNWVVNGSQEFMQNTESQANKGYLFDSGAPDPALFVEMGYGYALNERMQLDLGFSTASTIWEPANKRPIGGFIRINYFIR